MENTGILFVYCIQYAWHPNVHYFIQMLRKKRVLLSALITWSSQVSSGIIIRLNPLKIQKKKTKQNKTNKPQKKKKTPSLFVQA